MIFFNGLADLKKNHIKILELKIKVLIKINKSVKRFNSYKIQLSRELVNNKMSEKM